MTVIYIPIEVTWRSSAILASSLVARGHKVYIFQDYLFDKHGYPSIRKPFQDMGQMLMQKAMNNGVSYFWSRKHLVLEIHSTWLSILWFKICLFFASEALNFEHGDRLCLVFIACETLNLPSWQYDQRNRKSPFASCKPEWKQFYKSFTFSIEPLSYLLVHHTVFHGCLYMIT